MIPGFREATAADIPAIVALLLDDHLGATREHPGDPAYLAGFQAMQRQGGTILLALLGDEVVGCLQLDILHGVSHRGAARAQVESVRIAATHRGQGLGAALMQEAMHRARDAGASLMQLTTNLSRADAQRFYERIGFVRSHAGMKLDLEPRPTP